VVGQEEPVKLVTTERLSGSRQRKGEPVASRFGADLSTRREIRIHLPAFLLLALEARVAEANDRAPLAELSTIADYIEAELANIITLRDVAELEGAHPGFASALQEWLGNIRG
jgi:single-stranded DNA-specific DHH superfamily exonuclease